MIVNVIQNSRNNNQKNTNKPIQSVKQNTKNEAAENSYQALLHQALMAYQR